MGETTNPESDEEATVGEGDMVSRSKVISFASRIVGSWQSFYGNFCLHFLNVSSSDKNLLAAGGVDDLDGIINHHIAFQVTQIVVEYLNLEHIIHWT